MPSQPPHRHLIGNSSTDVDGKSEELMWQSAGGPAKTRGRHLAGNGSGGVGERESCVVSDVAGELGGDAGVGGGGEFQQGGLGRVGDAERGDETPQRLRVYALAAGQ